MASKLLPTLSNNPYPALTEQQMETYKSFGLTDDLLEEANKKAMERCKDDLKKLCCDTRSKNRHDKKVLRLLLVGKTGAGKSSTGNLIVGEKKFIESLHSVSCTATIKIAECMIDDVRVEVIDTPGFNDTHIPFDDIMTEMGKVVDYFKDGIDAVLFVYTIGNPRFTEEEKQSFEQLQEGLLGEDFIKNCFFIITHGKNIIDASGIVKYLQAEAESKSEFGILLNETLERRVMAVENSESTEYGRQLQREQIVRMIINLAPKRTSPKIFEQFVKSQRDIARQVPEDFQPWLPKVERMVVNEFVEKPRSVIINMPKAEIDDFKAKIVKELRQEMQLRDKQMEALRTADLMVDSYKDRVIPKEKHWGEHLLEFTKVLLSAAGQIVPAVLNSHMAYKTQQLKYAAKYSKK